MFPRDAPPRQLTIHRNQGALRFDLSGAPVEKIDKLEVQWPSQSLRTQTLIDTPGIASLSTDTSARAGAFLAPEDAPTQADAVIYLMRHLHATDVRFLESFYDQGVARATPINTIARAVAGGRDRRRTAGRAELGAAHRPSLPGRRQDPRPVPDGRRGGRAAGADRAHDAPSTSSPRSPRWPGCRGPSWTGCCCRWTGSPGSSPTALPTDTARPAHGPVRPVRGAAGGHADPAGRHRPDGAGGRARAPQRPRRPPLAAHHPVRRAARAAQGAVRAAGRRPGAEPRAAARRRAAGRRGGAHPRGRARVRRAAAARDASGPAWSSSPPRR